MENRIRGLLFQPPKLGDGQKGKQYVVCGFMIEKIWEMFSLYANFENFTDRRQTRFDTIYTGSISNPVSGIFMLLWMDL